MHGYDTASTSFIKSVAVDGIAFLELYASIVVLQKTSLAR
jgi:hypothetical protein